MRVAIHTHQLEAEPDLKIRLEKELLAQLGRFERWVRSVTIRVHGEAGEVPLATCCVLVDLHPGGGPGVEEAAVTPEVAFARAIFRTRAVLVDHLRRQHGLPPENQSGHEAGPGSGGEGDGACSASDGVGFWWVSASSRARSC